MSQTVSQSAGQGANQWLNSLPESLEGLFLRHSLLFSDAPTWHPHVPFRMDTEVTQLMWLLIFRGFPPALSTATTVFLLLRATFLGSLILGSHGGWEEPGVWLPPRATPPSDCTCSGYREPHGLLWKDRLLNSTRLPSAGALLIPIL